MEEVLHRYPPAISQDQLADLIFNIKDWQIAHGMLLKYGPDAESISSTPIGVSAFPSPFPKQLYELAVELQPIYNRLYAAVSEDEQWLGKVLKGLIDDGGFAAVLWKIYNEVKKEGYLQDIVLGLFRSDYMLHVSPKEKAQSAAPRLGLRQIEFNTFSVAGGAHSDKAAQLHQFMINSGSYGFRHSNHHPDPLKDCTIPENKTISTLAAGLKIAHTAYGEAKHVKATTPGVLFVVQPKNVNICDERPLEYAMWQYDPPIPAYRVIFGAQVLECTYLSPSGELLYRSPSLITPVEIAVVYLRAGYELDEYSSAGISARLQLERSRAIKCPSILCHLATFKKVQQELATPGTLARFLPPDEAALVAETFAPMYPLDGTSKIGRHGRELARSPMTAVDYVLKPSLEGGGHNTYRSEIPYFLKMVPEARWHTYILMKLINPLTHKNVLLTPRGTYTKMTAEEDRYATDPHIGKKPPSKKSLVQEGGPTVSELGIFGVCLWKRTSEGSLDIMQNSVAGWSLKTKPDYVDEMSVVKGYGCFDSPLLVG